MSKVSKAVKKYVQNALKESPEHKVYDTAQVNPAAGNVNYDVGSFQVLTNMAQGTSQITRLGDQIRPVSLRVRGYAIGANNATGVPTSIRVIVFQDTDQDATSAVIGDILDMNGVTSDFIAPYAPQTKGERIKVLHDKIYDIPLAGYAAGSITGIKHFDFWVHGLPAKITYNGAAAGKNTIETLITSNQSNASGFEPIVYMTSQFVFTDA